MVAFRSLDDLTVAGQRVLVRGDLNVPMREGAVSDTTRIDRLAPTLTELAEAGAIVVVLSHFGRPKGKPNPEMSLGPVREALSAAVGRPVAFAEDCVGGAAQAVVTAAAPGDVVLLENLRFHAGEEANDAGFADDLAALGDLYVNDAFSCAHRAHASVEALARRLPAAVGRGMQAELEALGAALEAPQHPVVAVVGGAKVSTKLALLGNLIGKVDALVVGGGMANTFLYANGKDVGASLCETDMADTARQIMADADKAGCRILLPDDAIVAPAFKAGAPATEVGVDAVPGDQMILDLGPKAIAALSDYLDGCKTLLWNGPLGAFEIAPFDAGTNAVAQKAAALSSAGKLTSVAGGGDTVAALRGAGVLDQFTYVSTAGGAFLEWLEGKTLPGVAVLLDQAEA